MDWTDGRPYNETHPWLLFAFHPNFVPIDLAASLGSVAARCRVLEGVFLPPAVSSKLHNIYLAKGVHGTTAIEGNVLSEDDVRQRIEGTKEFPKSLEYQQREVDNILKACNAIRENLADKTWEPGLSVERIKLFNNLVLDGLPLDEKVVPGEVRTYPVGVADYSPPSHKFCEELLGRLCDWLNELYVFDQTSHPIANAIMRAILAHVYIAWIHPFGDGNGRTARLLEVDLLLAAKIPTVAAHLLSNHYNQTRAEYLGHLSLASKSGGDLTPFIKYAVQGLLDGLSEQFKKIEQYQQKITWRNYIHIRFRRATGHASRRRRQLILALGERAQEGEELAIVAKKELTRLNAELAELYSGKTAKTLSRDLNELEEMELLIQNRSLVVAATWKLNAFKPGKKPFRIKHISRPTERPKPELSTASNQPSAHTSSDTGMRLGVAPPTRNAQA